MSPQITETQCNYCGGLIQADEQFCAKHKEQCPRCKDQLTKMNMQYVGSNEEMYYCDNCKEEFGEDEL